MEDEKRNQYFKKMDEVAGLANSIKQKTLMFYSEADGIVDTYALEKFARSLPAAEVHVYPSRQRVSHVMMMDDQFVINKKSSSLDLMEKFIYE